ncbi:hypothetical protein [Amycolatopsis nigrescens]|uniref:hypothetical protein n=1 Tax=Amycolatopsis nigrescens TaxID=381445 RepID=UPI00037A3BBB|nr:hypothetical protein [Amycolatopsis nigrescens]
MPGNLLHVNATITCPHGGHAAPRPDGTRVLVDGTAVTTLADPYLVTGCPFTVSGKPQPCVRVHWEQPSGRLRLNGSPVLLQSSVGSCLSAEGAPQGSALVVVVQQRGAGR